MNIFAKRLKKTREKLKDMDAQWTQGYVANKIGVARSSYTSYENGTKQPPLETVNKIADLFDLSADYLLGRTDNPVKKNDNPINISFRDGGEDISEEEAEYLEQQLKYFRELRKKFQQGE